MQKQCLNCKLILKYIHIFITFDKNPSVEFNNGVLQDDKCLKIIHHSLAKIVNTEPRSQVSLSELKRGLINSNCTVLTDISMSYSYKIRTFRHLKKGYGL